MESDSLPVLSLWKAIGRTISGYMLVVDRAHKICFVNRVEEGYSIGDVIGRSIHDFSIPETAEVFRTILADVFANGEVRSLETNGTLLSGKRACYAVHLGPIIVAGRIEAVLICASDILPLRVTEESLRHEQRVLHQLLEIQERERQLISYEIHDGLSQYLAGAILHLQALEHARQKSIAASNLAEALRLLQTAVTESRRLISGLRPSSLDELGIVAAIESLIDEFRKTMPNIVFTSNLQGNRLLPQLETAIFRIVQESLTNIRKHAAAQAVSVALEESIHPDGTAGLRITVQDNGIGFNPSEVSQERFGLEGIRQRSIVFGGQLQIQSGPHGGTKIDIILPLVPADLDPTAGSSHTTIGGTAGSQFAG